MSRLHRGPCRARHRLPASDRGTRARRPGRSDQLRRTSVRHSIFRSLFPGVMIVSGGLPPRSRRSACRWNGGPRRVRTRVHRQPGSAAAPRPRRRTQRTRSIDVLRRHRAWLHRLSEPRRGQRVVHVNTGRDEVAYQTQANAMHRTAREALERAQCRGRRPPSRGQVAE
jgi:hypothetical protein